MAQTRLVLNPRGSDCTQETAFQNDSDRKEAAGGETPTQVVPDVHFSAQRSHFNDALAQEIIRFPLQTLLHLGLDVVVLVPDAHFDSVGEVVALAEIRRRRRREKQKVSVC